MNTALLITVLILLVIALYFPLYAFLGAYNRRTDLMATGNPELQNKIDELTATLKGETGKVKKAVDEATKQT